MGVEFIKIKEEDDGIRLNKWFLKYYPALSMGRMQKLLRNKEIKLNGKKTEANIHLSVGDELRLPPLDNEKKLPTENKVSQSDAEFILQTVIYKDENIIVINKPSGLAVQGGTNTCRHVDGMLEALKFDKEEAPKLVHRIDKDTSGVLVLARNRKYADILTKAFREHQLQKTYLALTAGCPKPMEGVIKSKIEDKYAQTEYKVIDEVGEKFALVELNPKTGRKHQIRIHLNEIDCPIMGDDKYGFEKNKSNAVQDKLHLHAYKINLSAVCNKKCEITAKMPEYFKKDLQNLGIRFDD